LIKEAVMSFSQSASPTAESLVIELLRSSSPLTMDELVTRLPELRWNEVFHAIDQLSRHGQILLRRQGFSYQLCLPPVMGCCA
jgi:hypothetical protein